MFIVEVSIIKIQWGIVNGWVLFRYKAKDHLEISHKKIYNVYTYMYTRRILSHSRFIFFYFHTSENNGDVADSC